MYRRYAVITTRDRPTELATCILAIGPQVDQVIVVDNMSDPPAHDAWALRHPMPPFELTFMSYPDPVNLYAMWNVGFNLAETDARRTGHDSDHWDVAVFNDDAVPYPGWAAEVIANMEETGAVLGSIDRHGRLSERLVKTGWDGNIMTRMCGWAFIVRGEVGLRADESFRWWFGDDDFERYALEHGPTVLIPGTPVPNTLANSTTVGELAEQAGRDRERFAEKWGTAPW